MESTAKHLRLATASGANTPNAASNANPRCPHVPGTRGQLLGWYDGATYIPYVTPLSVIVADDTLRDPDSGMLDAVWIDGHWATERKCIPLRFQKEAPMISHSCFIGEHHWCPDPSCICHCHSDLNSAIVNHADIVDIGDAAFQWETCGPCCEHFDGDHRGDGSCFRPDCHATPIAGRGPTPKLSPLFPETWCSSCGVGFGPGDHGFSHCEDHGGRGRRVDKRVPMYPPRPVAASTGPGVCPRQVQASTENPPSLSAPPPHLLPDASAPLVMMQDMFNRHFLARTEA